MHRVWVGAVTTRSAQPTELNDMTKQQKRMVAFDDWFAEAEKDLAWRMRWMHCEMRRDANHEPTWKRRGRS